MDNRHSKHSIDLAVDLEHALNNEEHNDSEHGLHQENHMMNDKNQPDGDEERYDPEILTSIIIQLRATLVNMTHERDESNEALAAAGHKYAALEAKTADLSELLTLEKDRCAALEVERDHALHSAKENEEQVNMLRAKVEESRRGVMRLQAESRRVSTQNHGAKSNGPLPLDLSSPARSPVFASPFTPGANKRQSFQVGPRPLLSGQGHRRISSMSDPGQSPGGDVPPVPHMPIPLSSDGLPPSPVTHTFGSGSESQTADQAKANWKRASLMAKKRDPRDQSPSNGLAPAGAADSGRRSASPPTANSVALAAELEVLKSELTVTKKELETVTRDLAEAHDAKEAADALAKTLREFIAEQSIGLADDPPAPSSSSQHNMPGSSSSSIHGWGDPASVTSPGVGLRGIKLPPLPTDSDIPEEPASKAQPVKAKGAWSLGLWKDKTPDTSSVSGGGGLFTSSASPTPGTTAPIADPNRNGPSPAATPLTSFVSSWTRGVNSNNPVSSSAMGASSNSETVSIASSSGSAGPSHTATPPVATGLRKFSFFSSKSVPQAPTGAASPPVAPPLPPARSPPTDTQSLGTTSIGLNSISSSATTDEPVSPKSNGGDNDEMGFTSVVLADGNEEGVNGQSHGERDVGQTLEISHSKIQGDATPTMANMSTVPLSHT
ncbi:hypothetical protein FRB94_002734 [Tulasnella sp. JGI-2019a]|nr:hypothetical protein FRB94_002734 [Tulasnella sp. JGI-2019a]KAG9013334.1 hypothetical protein FRB93_000857 [Tulasnella sp. JGI-2019a]